MRERERERERITDIHYGNENQAKKNEFASDRDRIYGLRISALSPV